MKLGHFERLAPVCPNCQIDHDRRVAVAHTLTARADGDDVLEGALQCPDCGAEYPIVHGIPLLLPKLDEYLQTHLEDVVRIEDFSTELGGVLGDILGQQSNFDRSRQLASSYCWGHYGDLDPGEPMPTQTATVLDLLSKGRELAGPLPAGPRLDTGCAVGRTTFELARDSDDLVLGVDVNVAMLRIASRALRTGEVRYPRRRSGVIYEHRAFQADLPGRDKVDFWACDAQSLPFSPNTFGAAVSLNVLDVVSAPGAHLQTLGTVLAPGAPAMIATPYEWTSAATPIAQWIGGKEQRGPAQGRSERVLRAMLAEGGEWSKRLGLTFVADTPSVPWTVRMHDRGYLQYAAHVLVAKAL